MGKVDPGGLEVDRVTTVVAAGRAVCLVRTAHGYGALDNHCPHQGGPLGDGQLADGYLICPWHAYEYDPVTGVPPPGFKDAATGRMPSRTRRRRCTWSCRCAVERESLMDQLVAVLCEWGLDTVFGMVGHSNLGSGRRAAQGRGGGSAHLHRDPPRGRGGVRRFRLREARRVGRRRA